MTFNSMSKVKLIDLRGDTMYLVYSFATNRECDETISKINAKFQTLNEGIFETDEIMRVDTPDGLKHVMAKTRNDHIDYSFASCNCNSQMNTMHFTKGLDYSIWTIRAPFPVIVIQEPDAPPRFLPYVNLISFFNQSCKVYAINEGQHESLEIIVIDCDWKVVKLCMNYKKGYETMDMNEDINLHDKEYQIKWYLDISRNTRKHHLVTREVLIDPSKLNLVNNQILTYSKLAEFSLHARSTESLLCMSYCCFNCCIKIPNFN